MVQKTPFEIEIDNLVELVVKFGLPEIAWKHEIQLTKQGKVDRRTKVGRALAPRLEELDSKMQMINPEINNPQQVK